MLQISRSVTFVVGQCSFRYADGEMVSVVVLRSPSLACPGWGYGPLLQMPTEWDCYPNYAIAASENFLLFSSLFF